MLFDLYLFADYSGARARSAQRKAIRLAKANRKDSPTIVEKRFTREELTAHFVECLSEATHQGVRVCFGQDHQYGIPFALGRDLGLVNQPWRNVLDKLCSGSYGTGAPALAHPATFGAAFNKWLTNRGSKPFFYSATKSKRYGVPSRNPRGGDKSTYRLTELCKPLAGAGNPMPFNRLGDNGAVGGQSLVGMISLHELLKVCSEEGIPVAVWPFDGLSIVDSTYGNAHVLVEPHRERADVEPAGGSSDDRVGRVYGRLRADPAGDLPLRLRQAQHSRNYVAKCASYARLTERAGNGPPPTGTMGKRP